MTITNIIGLIMLVPIAAFLGRLFWKDPEWLFAAGVGILVAIVLGYVLLALTLLFQ